MTTAMTTDLELLRTRVTGAVGRQLPGQIERLGWPAGRLAAWQRDRLRTLLARAIERSPFHAARLRGIDPGRFELADLPRLPVMTKAEMMEGFDVVATDRRLTRDVVERHLAGSAAVEGNLRRAGLTGPRVRIRRVGALDRDPLTGKARRFIPLVI
jgi:hypothetical protein